MSEMSSRAGGGWLRPSYGRKSFRVDVLWYDVRTSNPYEFFNKLWKALIANDEKLKQKQESTPLRTKDLESSAGSAIGKTVHVNVDSKSEVEAEVIFEEDEKVQEAGNCGTRQKTTTFRPHWAKWFPGGNVKFPKSGHIPGFDGQRVDGKPIWRDYYKSQYPKWDKWLELRKRMDPNNVFMNEYWAAVFGIDIRSHPTNAPETHLISSV